MNIRFNKHFDPACSWGWAVIALIAIIYMIGSIGCMSHAHLARKCAIEFPPKVYDSTRIEVIDGETVFKYDTVTVNCDSLIIHHEIDYGTSKKANVFRVPCPPSTHRVDTVNTTSVRQIENTARVEVLIRERDGARIDKARIQNGRNSWRMVALILLALTVLRYAGKWMGGSLGGIITKIL